MPPLLSALATDSAASAPAASFCRTAEPRHGGGDGLITRPAGVRAPAASGPGRRGREPSRPVTSVGALLLAAVLLIATVGVLASISLGTAQRLSG